MVVVAAVAVAVNVVVFVAGPVQCFIGFIILPEDLTRSHSQEIEGIAHFICRERLDGVLAIGEFCISVFQEAHGLSTGASRLFTNECQHGRRIDPNGAKDESLMRLR